MAINQAWRDDRLFGAERFIVSELFAEILNSLTEPSRENPYQREWTNAKLPTYAAGLVSKEFLVFVHRRPDVLIHGASFHSGFWIIQRSPTCTLACKYNLSAHSYMTCPQGDVLSVFMLTSSIVSVRHQGGDFCHTADPWHYGGRLGACVLGVA